MVLIMLFVPLAFSRFTFEKFETIKFALFYVLFGLALIYILSRNRVQINRRWHWGLALFVLLSLLSAGFAPDKLYSFFGRGQYWFGFNFILIWSLFVVALSNLLNEQRLNWLANILIFGGVINAVLAILQAFGIGYYESPYTIGYLLRPPALFGNPNYIAMFLAGLIPLVLYALSIARTFWLKLYFSTTGFILIFALAVLSSRGALLGAFAGLGVLIVLCWVAKNRKLGSLAMVALLFAAVLYLLFSGPFRATYTGTGPFDSAEENVITRLNMWRDGIQIVKARPITGIGFGNLTGNTHDAHNIFLNLAIAGGLPLVITFLGLICAAFVMAWRRVKTSPTNLVYMSGLSAWLIAASFNPVTLPNWILLGLILAALTYENVDLELKLKVRQNVTLRLVATVSILAGLALIASQTFLYLGLKANLQTKNYSLAKSHLFTAASLDPSNDFARQQYAGALIFSNAPTQESANAIKNYLAGHAKEPDIALRAGRLYYELYLRSGERQYLDLALSEILDSLKLNPQMPDAYFYLAEYSLKDNPEQASRYVEEGLVKTSDPKLWLILADSQIQKGDLRAAEVSINALFESYTNNKELKHALAKLRLGQPAALPKLNVPNNPYFDPGVQFSTPL